METFTRFVMPGLAFVFALVTGFWLSRIARPFSTVVVTVHKLIALGSVVTAVAQIARLLKLNVPTFSIVLLILAVLCTLGLFISGALLSQPKSAPIFVLRVHQAAPPLLLASTIASIWLWIGGK
ncbi:MAG TPA: hypothetical protein VN452_05500 [Longilinea sp.]|nr:hypothetical protein [Longilinea sp.]